MHHANSFEMISPVPVLMMNMNVQPNVFFLILLNSEGVAMFISSQVLRLE